MNKKIQAEKQLKPKINSPKWYQTFWAKAISTLTVIGVVVAILSDGGQVLDMFSGASEKDTLPKEINNNTNTYNTNNTFQPENTVLPAKVSLSLFTLNSEICHYKQTKTKNNGLKILSTLPSERMFDADMPPFVFMDISRGDTSYFSNIEGNENPIPARIDTIKVNDSNRLPIFDVTVLNEGGENVILHQIKVHVFSFFLPEGDGIEGGGKSFAIQSINRYKVVLPDLYEIFKKPNGEYIKKEFIQEYPALPPLLIASRDPARFQVQLGNSQNGGAEYVLSFEFVFSNKQSIFSDRIEITF